jgi:hypothetical protein
VGIRVHGFFYITHNFCTIKGVNYWEIQSLSLTAGVSVPMSNCPFIVLKILRVVLSGLSHQKLQSTGMHAGMEKGTLGRALARKDTHLIDFKIE